MKDFLVEILPIEKVDDFTRIPIKDGAEELCIRHDGVLFDGFLYLWEEIESVRIFRLRRQP